MALNAFNAALGMAQDYEELAIIRTLEDEGMNIFMYFLSRRSRNSGVSQLQAVHLFTEKLKMGEDH